jgi:hypothetical protein
MRAEWSTEDLVGSWTLVDEDWRLVQQVRADPVGFALLLKFFELEARFPRSVEDLAVSCVARNRAIVAWSGCWLAATTRNATSSTSRRSILRLDRSPVQ